MQAKSDYESIISVEDNPGLDVNWTDHDRLTAIHWDSLQGHAEVVKLLLAHPHININLTSSNGQTPLVFGCSFLSVSVVRVLLKDFRVDVTLDDGSGHSTVVGILGWAS